MSKQYLTIHTLDSAHPTDIFSLASTPKTIISASGSSTLRVHDTTDPTFPLVQELPNAHALGCHHITCSGDGTRAVSAGFGGEVKIWKNENGAEWSLAGKIEEAKKAGEIWAVALGQDGRFLATTSCDGRVCMWDLQNLEQVQKIREYETKGSFGMAVAISSDSNLIASSHQNGTLHVFNNTTSRLAHSLPGLIKPIRAIAFSPLNRLLAAAGDTMVIALYDVQSGEQVANLSGHASWVTSLEFSRTGEWLLSTSADGKCKVWGMETRTCVATHGEGGGPLWAGRWVPALPRTEMFAVAGANKGIAFYREASGG